MSTHCNPKCPSLNGYVLNYIILTTLWGASYLFIYFLLRTQTFFSTLLTSIAYIDET